VDGWMISAPRQKMGGSWPRPRSRGRGKRKLLSYLGHDGCRLCRGVKFESPFLDPLCSGEK